MESEKNWQGPWIIVHSETIDGRNRCPSSTLVFWIYFRYNFFSSFLPWRLEARVTNFKVLHQILTKEKRIKKGLENKS